MNKKANTILFVLGATVANLVLMAIVFTLLLVGASFALQSVLTAESEGIGTLVLGLVFVATILITYFVYHKSVKKLSEKYDFERYFEPIFGKKRR
ncbi:MAG: hypothetical protein ACOCRN_01280 [Spirochaetia bacterium]